MAKRKNEAINYTEYIQKIREAEFEYCRNDIVYWANNYCVIEDKDSAEIVVPFRAWEAQGQVLRDFDEYRLNLILKARQMGITWIALYYCTHDLIFNLGHTVVALSKTEDDAKELVRRMSVVLDNQPEILRGGGLIWKSTATSITITDPRGKLVSTFKAFPASPSAGRSFTGNILLLDEWAFQEFAAEIWTSAYPTINRPTGGKVIGLSTIKRGTLFENLWLEDNAFHKIFLGCFCDPRRTQEWYDQTAKDLGVKVKQEYPRTAEEALSNLGGSFFSEFDYSIHTCEPFNIPSDWTIYNTMDYGLDKFAHYAKDRKDKDGNEISFVQDFFTDFASTTIGMFPVVKDIYNYFANDYEFSNFAYDSVNSILSASKDLFEVATKAAGGEPLETSDYMKPLRNSIYAIGQVTGLPVRNLNNMVSGIIKRFSPATAYKYNSIFYNAQYSKDIKSALAKGDTELADTIMGLLLDEDKAGNVSDGARKKLIALYEQGYSVLPKSVGDSLSYNGETIKLTAQQREKFKAVYSQANNYVERMVQNKAFGKLSDEKQAKAIKQVYDAYYDKALAETLGVTTDNKLLLVSKFVGMDALSIVLAGISEIQSDYDKNGAVIQGSKKKKVIQYLLQQNLTDAQRLMILYLQGYTLSDNEYKRLTADRAKRMVISSILTLKSSTQAEKIKLAELCGVEVKNGRIVTKSLYTAK